MYCRKCGAQNHSDAESCSNCGQRLLPDKCKSKIGVILAVVCLLILGIGIGLLISGVGASDEASLMETEDRAEFPTETLEIKETDSPTETEAVEIKETDSPPETEVMEIKETDSPPETEAVEIKETDSLPETESVEIKQVVFLADSIVAALYTDGTVRVSGNEDVSAEVSGWSRVTKLYGNDYSIMNANEPFLAGLTEDGTVLTTFGDFSSWGNVKELHVLAEGVLGVTHDGRVLTYYAWVLADEDAEVPAEWSTIAKMTNVDSLVPAYFYSGFMWVNKNGDAMGCDWFDPEPRVIWRDVKEVRDSGNGTYVIKKDGTVDGSMYDTYAGLKDAVKIVDFEDWLFGISADGRLLTHNGGSISPNRGDLCVAEPGNEGYYSDLVDIHQFDQVKDILPFWGLVLLNEDGTVAYIGSEPWDLSGWNNIEKLYGRYSWDDPCLYGIRKDGSVIIQQSAVCQDSYRGWKLKELYVGSEGVVGLTLDGKLVGDGIYENMDFSVFDR